MTSFDTGYTDGLFAVPTADFEWLAGLDELSVHDDDDGERSVYRYHDTDDEQFMAFSEFDGIEFMFYVTVAGRDRLER